MAKFSVLNTLYFSYTSQRGVCRSITSIHVSRPTYQLQLQQSYHQHQVPSTSNLTTQLSYCGCSTRSYYGFSNGYILHNPSTKIRHASTTSEGKPCAEGDKQPEPKLTLYQRFKAMYRDYWYVLLPVHLVTSAGWFGGFYYMASSGVDIVALLESLNVSEKLINPLRNGHATTGYLAIAYALYKIATPIRYTVTLGGTTIAINYLLKWGYIKPVPSKEKLKKIYEGKKEIIIEKGQSLKNNMMDSLKPTESKKKSS